MSSAQLHRRVRRLEVVRESDELLFVFIASFVGEIGDPVRITRGAESWTRDQEETAEAFRERVEQIQAAIHAHDPFPGDMVVLCVENRASPAEIRFPGKTFDRAVIGVDQ
jgi:hypothetical protein